jgi:AraC-like DNA-binding protein
MGIHSIWQTHGIPGFHKERILPKGIVEIIFNFSEGGPVEVGIGDRTASLPACFINGFNTGPIHICLPRQLSFFGVQMQPLAVKKVLGFPAGEFSNRVVDLSLVDSAFLSHWHHLAELNGFENRVKLITGWMEKKLSDPPPQETGINFFLQDSGNYSASVKELARSLCYSPRQLSRKLNEATGMNTEEILLYKKYLHAVRLMHYTNLSLTQIAYQSQFSDQSHFIRSFKMYAQMTPGEYRISKGVMPGHIYENVR